MKLDRKDFLQRLLMVEPAISKKEVLQQSSCIVLRAGRLLTLSQEIACSLSSGLPEEFAGAIRAENLIELFKRMPEDEVELTIESKTLYLKGKGRKAKLMMEEDVLLPVDEVELPVKDKWQKLHPDFAEAVDLVHRCTRKKDDFIKECVHVHPDYLEATDNTRMIRYTMPTFVSEPCLVRGESIKCLVQLGMSLAQESSTWLHFRNPTGLRLSVRKFSLEEYPPLESFLGQRGRSITFPKGLQEAAERAGLFTEEGEAIKITLSEDKLLMQGKNVTGEYTEGKRIKYKGESLSFYIPAKLIAEIVKDHSECEITPVSLRATGGKFVYCSSLMENGQ